METELYRRHRPRNFKDVTGQAEAVAQLTRMVKEKKVPHAILFHGPSGTGKTTLARILAAKLGCGGTDLVELNCADLRGIDNVRDIRSRMGVAPLTGSARVWILDEFHKVSNDGQNAILKMLEDCPGHVYFFLCTTEAHKVIKTVQTRCSPIKLTALTPKQVGEAMSRVLSLEGGLKVSSEVAGRIIEVADGSARMAVVLLEACLSLDDDETRLTYLRGADPKRQSYEVFQALISGRPWADLAKILRGVDQEPEEVRRLVLACAVTVLIGKEGRPPNPKQFKRAAAIIDAFEMDYFASGKAGLVNSCYRVAGG